MASMHGKHRACSLAFIRGLRLSPKPLLGIDTDRLGTFCGEVPRLGTAQQVVLEKARLALQHPRESHLALASEGSFSPHPDCPWVSVHSEYLVFLDGNSGKSWLEVGRSYRTNFAERLVQNLEQQREFARTAGFPGHHLMVKVGEGNWLKGIRYWKDLPDTFPQLLATDMRAHCNPTRQQLIRRLSWKLVIRLQTNCVRCDRPGFGGVENRTGLPCSHCGCPTAWIGSTIWRCEWCDHSEERARSDGLRLANPCHCEVCNP